MASLEAIERISAFERLNHIQQRISEIENKFGVRRTENNFQNVLEQEMAKVMPIEEFLAAANRVQPSNNVQPSSENQPANNGSNNSNLNASEYPLRATVIPESVSREVDPSESAPEISPQNATRRAVNYNPTTTEQMIEAAARRFGVESDLVKAIATAESNMNQNARSYVGAIGVMQLMPETAANLGVDPYDERQNIEGGAHYIRQMLDKFNGNVRYAIAAYNAGPGAVQRYGGIPPYSETQNYVGRVMDFYAR